MQSTASHFILWFFFFINCKTTTQMTSFSYYWVKCLSYNLHNFFPPVSKKNVYAVLTMHSRASYIFLCKLHVKTMWSIMIEKWSLMHTVQCWSSEGKLALKILCGFGRSCSVNLQFLEDYYLWTFNFTDFSIKINYY